MTNPSTTQPAHGTLQRYRDRNCRCWPCSNANTMRRRAQRHAENGLRPDGCRCTTCRDDPNTPPPPVKHRRVGCLCQDCTQKRLAALAAPAPVDEWAFERYALYPAVPVGKDQIQPKSFICCETEGFEIEGSGHDWDCPRVVAA